MAIFDEFQVARILASTAGQQLAGVLDGLPTESSLGGAIGQRVCYELAEPSTAPVIRQLAATLGGTQAQLDEKYGTGASSTSIAPNRPTTILGPPNQVIPNGDDMYNFSCPTNAADCLAAIPRTDVTQVYNAQIEEGSTRAEIIIDLDDARGMVMQDICALINVVTNSSFEPKPTAQDQQAFYQTLFFLGNWTLRFRDTDVPGFKERPLSDIAEKPGCCDDPCAHVGCVVPQYGGMSLVIDVPAIPDWVDYVVPIVRVKFTGCPTNQHAGCGCGCGGGSVVRNPFIISPGQLAG